MQHYHDHASAGGAEVARRITHHLADHHADYHVVVATRDWHVDPGPHFSDTPDHRDSWLLHCVAGTPGAEFHPDLATSLIDAVVGRGKHSAAYSGFEGTDGSEDLASILAEEKVHRVDVCGRAEGDRRGGRAMSVEPDLHDETGIDAPERDHTQLAAADRVDAFVTHVTAAAGR